VELKDWRTALREVGEETIDLDLYVEPGASETSIGPYDPWRQRIKVRVAAPATSGKANKELVRAIADLFDLPSRSVHIARGATTRRKTVQVTGVSKDRATEVLDPVLDRGTDPT
jgi:uncharacterized protein (TIGR00251 family)